jgi:hypothetical protein
LRSSLCNDNLPTALVHGELCPLFFGIELDKLI